jgi:hypothetical protein
MTFTINIPVTRKRTKHGYYLMYRTGGRFWFLRKQDAINGILNDLRDIATRTRIVTARDYSKSVKGNNKPPK